jgi:hypothetical protein
MTSPRTAPQAGHRKAVEPGISEIAGYLQEILGQKLIAHIADESDPSTVALWAAGQIPPS